MIYTWPFPVFPPFLRTLLHPSQSFFTELLTFIPLVCPIANPIANPSPPILTPYPPFTPYPPLATAGLLELKLIAEKALVKVGVDVDVVHVH